MLLLTGSEGYVGSFVASALLASGIPFAGLARIAPARSNRYPVLSGDLTDPDSLRAAVTGKRGVIHCASTLSSTLATVLHADVVGTAALCSALEEGPFIFMSSMDVYPQRDGAVLREGDAVDPPTEYGRGKLLCEHLVTALGRRPDPAPSTATQAPPLARSCCATVLRLPYVVGPHERFGGSSIGRIVGRALLGLEISIRREGTGFSWISAEELGELVARLATTPVEGVYNVASGWISLREAAATIVELTGSASTISFRDATAADAAWGHAALPTGRFIDTSRARGELGFAPRKSFADALRDVVDSPVFRERAALLRP